MVIQYSVIARGGTILCSHQTHDANFDTVMESILPNIPTTNDIKTTYTSNSYMFHVMVNNGIIYLCATEPSSSKREPYAFLAEIHRQFSMGSLSHRALYAGEGELNRDFQPVLATQMERFSRQQGSDQLSVLQSQVEEVKGVMTQNIERVLERGQRLEELMEKTTDLEANAATFQKTSRRVSRKMWWKNTRMTIILILVILLVLTIVILIILFSTGVLPPKSGNEPAPTPSTTKAP